MSQHVIDTLLDYQNEQREVIDKLKRQLTAAKGAQTKLRNEVIKYELELNDLKKSQ